MLELLFVLYVIGFGLILVGSLATGREPKESTTRYITICFIAAAGWPLWLVFLFVSFVWWGIVGD